MQLNQLIAGVILIELRFSKAKILWLMSTHPHKAYGHDATWGGGALFARKNYAVPHCLIVEISYLLPQNVRKNMRLQSLKGIKLYVIETQFLEPHILYVGLLDVVTIE